MSLALDRAVNGPATHALLVGVSYYHHLPGGAGRTMTNPMGLTQLKAPALAIPELVDFLTANKDRTAAPLASLDVLLGQDAGSPDHAEDRPTIANVRAAILRWVQRCNSAPNNVAFFYFCGHGFEGADHYLLMEDFGAFDELGLLENTLNLNRFYAGMAQCRAGTQLFFVDACRELPRRLERALPGGGQQVLEPRLDGNQERDAPILRAAAKGRQAFARIGESTQFVQALIQALRGAGAVEVDGSWQVRYQYLASAVGQLLANAAVKGKKQEVRTGGEAGDALIMRLDGPPEVPVIVLCDPAVCAEIASLEMQSLLRETRYRRAPAAGPWQLAAPPDAYRLWAQVEPPYSALPLKVLVGPPLRKFTVKVTS